MLILGFGNKARQGKDAAAQAILDFYKPYSDIMKVGIFKFATALYQEVNEYLKKYSIGHVGMWQNFSPSLRNLGLDYENVMIPDWVQPDPNPEVSELAPYGKHPKLLQWWGTDYRRAQDPDYWVNKLFENIPANLDIALVTDVRFPNEAQGIKQRGGYCINVTRLLEDGTPYVSGDRSADHPSEIALDGYNWDFYIKTKELELKQQHAITIAQYTWGDK